MSDEGQKDEDFGEGGNGQGDDKDIEIEVFPSGFGEIPRFGAVERWIFEVERGGEEEAADAYGEQEEEGREMGCYRGHSGSVFSCFSVFGISSLKLSGNRIGHCNVNATY